LEFLRDSGVISEGFFKQIDATVPRKYSPGAAPIGPVAAVGGEVRSTEKPAAPTPAPAPSPGPGQEVAEALYNFDPNEASDLPLVKGDRVVVLERLNPDWWRGRHVNSGREGLFPSNYVRVVSGEKQGFSPQQQQSMTYQPGYSAAPPGPPQAYYPPPYQSAPGPAPAPFPPPSANYYPQPQAVPEQQSQQQPQQHHTSEAMKKFGSKLGNAAIFGAGATIGSDLVNKIF
jgi:hypothetical protein